MKHLKALKTSLLPQYRESEDVFARFLVTAHEGADPEIARTEYIKRERSVRPTELELDALDFFASNETNLKDEFYHDLKEEVDEAKAKRFCEILADAWSDGYTRRKGGEVLPIRASVEVYLKYISGRQPTTDTSHALFTPREICKLLELNWRMLHTAVEDWIETHPRNDEFASSSVFFRRGLVLQKLFKDDHRYKELDVISSYTLSVTLAEQFANTHREDEKSAIVNADFYLFSDRLLFFSPFVPGMKSSQLEAGVIPGEKPARLKYMGIHRGVGEYLLDYSQELL